MIQTSIAAPTATLDKSANSGDPTDDITNVVTPSFSGTSEPNAKVTLTIGGETYQTTASTLGNWAIKVTNNLAEGFKTTK